MILNEGKEDLIIEKGILLWEILQQETKDNIGIKNEL